MRYQEVSELPEAVRGALPEPAQAVYLQVFNRSWDEREGVQESDADRDQAAHDMAWKVVERLTGSDPRDRWSSKATEGMVSGLGQDGERSQPVPDFRQGVARKTSGTRKTTGPGQDM